MKTTVRTLDMLDEELRCRIEAAAQALVDEGATEVYVFGSVMTDRFDEYSDIDLAVVGLPDERFFRAMGRAGDCLQRELSLVHLDDDNEFTRYLQRRGKLQRVA